MNDSLQACSKTEVCFNYQLLWDNSSYSVYIRSSQRFTGLLDLQMSLWTFVGWESYKKKWTSLLQQDVYKQIFTKNESLRVMSLRLQISWFYILALQIYSALMVHGNYRGEKVDHARWESTQPNYGLNDHKLVESCKIGGPECFPQLFLCML